MLDLKNIKELLSIGSPSPWVVTSYEGQTKTGKHKYSICSDNNDGLSEEHACVGDVWHEDENVSRANAHMIVWIRNNATEIISLIEASQNLAEKVKLLKDDSNSWPKECDVYEELKNYKKSEFKLLASILGKPKASLLAGSPTSSGEK